MLAVKLHRKQRPWLGRGSYLVPILDWRVGRVCIRNWMKILEDGWRGPNHTIRYLTLVRIPDDHPVSLHRHWVDQRVGVDCVVSAYLDEKGRAAFPALREIPAEVKDSLVRWSPEPRGGPNDPAPEVILGGPLRASDVLWTKSALRLYRDGGRS